MWKKIHASKNEEYQGYKMKGNSTTIEARKPSFGEGLETLPLQKDLPQPVIVLSHVLAASENNVIGKDNHLPWNLPNDFKFFKNKTWGMPVIMGRNTYESLDKPLPGRFNIVITRNPDWKRDGAIVAHSIDDAIAKAKETDCREIFIIGGAEIFKQSIRIVNKVYLTRVHATIKGDAFYPTLDKNKWKLTRGDPHPADEKHACAYTFQTWERSRRSSK